MTQDPTEVLLMIRKPIDAIELCVWGDLSYILDAYKKFRYDIG